MGWVTLNGRTLTLRTDINQMELQDIALSREIRGIQRNLSYQQSVYNKEKKRDLANAKREMNQVREAKPEDAKYGSNAYNEWNTTYQEKRSEFEEQKVEIEDYYDGLLEEIEQEATDRETEKQEEQTVLEANLEAQRAELDVVKEQVSSDIDSSTIKF